MHLYERPFSLSMVLCPLQHIHTTIQACAGSFAERRVSDLSPVWGFTVTCSRRLSLHSAFTAAPLARQTVLAFFIILAYAPPKIDSYFPRGPQQHRRSTNFLCIRRGAAQHLEFRTLSLSSLILCSRASGTSYATAYPRRPGPHPAG